MLQSEQTDALSSALVKVQGGLKAVAFDKTNPHYKNKYASLPAVIETLRKPLADNGLAVTQTTELRQGAFVLVTTLRHTSGQWVAGEYLLPQVSRPQEMGSAITYAKRYALSAMVCIAADEDDDDAEGARKDNQVATAPKRENPHVTRPEDLSDAKPRYDERGVRIDWIDTSAHRVERQSKAKSRPMFESLGKAMMASSSAADLVEWGEEHAELVASLPEEWETIMQNIYQEHLDALRHKQKRAA